MPSDAKVIIRAAAIFWLLFFAGQGLAASFASASAGLAASESSAASGSGVASGATKPATHFDAAPAGGTCDNGTVSAHCTSCGHCAVVVLNAAVHHPNSVRTHLTVTAVPLLDVPSGREPRPPQLSLLS